MKQLNLSEIQATKYQWVRLDAVVKLKLCRMGRICGEKVLLEALELARDERSSFGDNTLANHSASLPYEAQQALAEELLTFCQDVFSEEDGNYLKVSAERFFQKNSPAKHRAELLYKQAEDKARDKFEAWKQDLAKKLKHKTEKEQLEILRKRYSDLEQWYSNHKKPELLFDVEATSKENLVTAWKACFTDWKDGLKPLPGTPEFSEYAFEMQPDEFYMDALEVDETRLYPYIPFNWISALSERFFAVEGMNYLDETLSNIAKPANQKFGQELLLVVKDALVKMELVNSSDKFTGKPTHVKALYNVLQKTGYILGVKNPEENFAKWFFEFFGFEISDRALRNPPNKNQDEAEKEFKGLISDNK